MHSIAGILTRAVATVAWMIVVSVWLASVCAASLKAAEPLHVRIDQLADQAVVGPRGAVVDDLAFLRRVSLDLTGRIPSVVVAREFLADSSPDKRTRVVDRLIASPDFYRHMAVIFDVMLMERRGDKHVKSDEFRAWLQESFQKKRPYNEMVHDLLAADGTAEKQRAAAAFYLEREVEPNLLTREIGRMFLGIDVQCAQCHNHPLIDDYHQSDYFGLFAFVGQSTVFQPDPKKPALIAETVNGQSEFKSVFTSREAVTMPRLPDEVEIVEPVFAVGDEYQIRPAKNVRSLPKFSRREKLADLVSSGDNPLFRRNIANRLWALMMGRGLVHPVDHHHSENPATNPEILELLGNEFAQSSYDISTLLREIALSTTYQRSWQLPADLAPAADAAPQKLAQLNAAVTTADGQLVAKQGEAEAALTVLDEALAEAKPLRVALQKVLTAAEAAATKRDETAAAARGNQTKFDQKQSVAVAVRSAADSAKLVLASLSDDNELTAAATTLAAKAAAIEAEAAKLKATWDASVKAAAASVQTLADANTAVVPHRAALDPVEQKIRERRARHVALREEVRTARSIAQRAQRQIRFLESVAKLDGAEKQLASAAAELASLEPAIKTAEADYAAAENTRQSTETQLKSIQQATATSEATLTQLQTRRSSLEVGASAVESSLAAAKASLALISTDADLSQAVAVLDATQKRVGSDLAGVQQQVDSQQKATTTLQEQLSASQAAFDKATKLAADLKTRSTELAAKVSTARSQAEASRLTIDDSTELVIQEASSHFNIAVVESLTPEQLGWSILEATGQVDRQRAAELAKLNKEKPLKPEELADTGKLAVRDQEADTATYASLSKTVVRFVSLFGGDKGQPQDAFFATVDQALFFANGGEVRGWLAPSGENLAGRLLKLEDSAALAEELYLSVFTRRPSAEEIADISSYLEQRKEDRSAAVQEIAWALLTSVEFRFNH
ncbi:MAG: DUF1549 domain-containing protein [Planctomycetota bacterium]|nr:DUF1549 domain-containing protein [Planctomycetota bacterium]MDA1164541.1 DUF1549 domain-containing protein [Planctomycetota bacterium]